MIWICSLERSLQYAKGVLCLLLVIVILTVLSQQALGWRAAARTLENSRSLSPSFFNAVQF